MESPQQLDLPSWRILYSSDLEEERLMAKLSLTLPSCSPFTSCRRICFPQWVIFEGQASNTEKQTAKKDSGEEVRKKVFPGDFFQLSFVHSRVFQPCCVNLNWFFSI